MERGGAEVTIRLRSFSADVILVVAMAVRSIVRFPDPRLRQRSVEVGEIGDDVRQLVADMAETMVDANGAGLAAIQVGVPVAAVHRRRARGGRRRGFAAQGVHQPRDRRDLG